MSEPGRRSRNGSGPGGVRRSELSGNLPVACANGSIGVVVHDYILSLDYPLR